MQTYGQALGVEVPRGFIALCVFLGCCAAAFLFECFQYGLHALWHTKLAALHGVVNLGTLLSLRESVVAGDYLVEPGLVLAADVTQVASQLEGQRVTVALDGFETAVVQLPVLFQNVREGDAVILAGERCLRADG